jgi:hypothetical protein
VVAVPALVDDRQREVEPDGEVAGAFFAAHIRRHHRVILQLLALEVRGDREERV